MLTIQTHSNFGIQGKEKKKTQIILSHTSRPLDEYLTALKIRYNGKYDKIPNFVISKGGEIIQLISENSYSNFFPNEKVNRKSVFVCLENLGWLEKKPLSNEYINWNKSIYKGQVYEKKWRDFFFWEPYSEIQMSVTAELCIQLIESLKINKGCVGHNTKVEGVSMFEGITSRSNYHQKYTDLNPSFDFGILTKKIENEQLAQ